VQKVKAAGQWFPAEAPVLRAALAEAFKTADSRAGGAPPRKSLRALVAPHAALPYAGVVAAAAWRLAADPPNVILLGFSHRSDSRGVTAAALDAYETPLGRLPVNGKLVQDLGFPMMDGDRIADHSLENQMPFLQHVAPRASVVPLYVGDLAPEALDRAARKLAGRVRSGDLLVASSDFTHYGPAYGYTPFAGRKDVAGSLRRLAMQAFEAIGSLEVPEFDRHVASTGDTICGRAPVRLLMAALASLDEEIYPHIADSLTSGDLTGDYTMSVSYGALAFYPASAFQVGGDDRQRLLRSARATLDQYLSSGAKLAVTVPREDRGADLRQRTGAFVTIRKRGQIRACVGALAATKPLHDLVADRTLAAATQDERFPPLSADEGPVSLEVSLLTPVKRLPAWEAYREGRGAVLVLDGRGGVLLPQMAAEFGWDRRRFLENLCRKAGLPPDAYKDPKARLYVYEAQVFAEAESPPAPD
jgi:hypothetical protein